MPSNSRSVAVTENYRARLVYLRKRTMQTAATSWTGTVRLDDLDSSFRRWLSGAVALTSQAQAAAARLSVAYLAAFASSELAEAVPAAGVDVTAFVGATIYGRPLAALLAPTLNTVKAAVAQGRAEEASTLGRGRAVRDVGVQVDDAGRGALDASMDQSEVVRGWRRVTSGRPCGACIAAATGAIQRTDDVMLVHPHCSCSKEPVIDGASDHLRRPTGADLFHSMSHAEQDELFAGRGGEAKAAAIRSGVPLSRLIAHTDQVSGQTVITETPLQDLRKG